VTCHLKALTDDDDCGIELECKFRGNPPPDSEMISPPKGPSRRLIIPLNKGTMVPTESFLV